MTNQELTDLFVDITPAERTEVLDAIAPRKVSPPDAACEEWEAPAHVVFRGQQVTPSEVKSALTANPLDIELHGEVERDDNGWMVRCLTVDGTQVAGTWVKSRRVAERLADAFEDGVAAVPLGHAHSLYDGSQYLVTDKRVTGRRASADLKALEY